MLRRTQNIFFTYLAVHNSQLVRLSIEVLMYAEHISGRNAVAARSTLVMDVILDR